MAYGKSNGHVTLNGKARPYVPFRNNVRVLYVRYEKKYVRVQEKCDYVW